MLLLSLEYRLTLTLLILRLAAVFLIANMSTDQNRLALNILEFFQKAKK